MKQAAPVEARTRRGYLRYLSILKTESQKHRKVPTLAEIFFWKNYLNNDKTGFRFLRQKPIGRFILDFYCPKLLVAIEIDGSSHKTKINYDKDRDLYLNNRGIVTIRYNNDQIYNNINQLFMDLMDKLNIRNRELNSQFPSLSKRG